VTTTDVPPAAARGPLGRREFRLYFAGNLISNIGNWLNNVALSVYMLELTGSSFWVGVGAAGLTIPILLFALPAGALADRADRVLLLRRAQAVSFCLASLLAIIVATGSANRIWLIAVAAGLGTCGAVAIPAMQSMIPSMVPPSELPEAIGLNALTFNIARVVGPLLAAAILTTVGAVWAFWINAATFLPLVAVLAIIRRPPFPRTAGLPGPIAEGISYAWNHLRTRTMLLAIVAIGFSLDPISTLAPALAKSFGIAAGGAGWIVTSWGTGAVLGLTAGRSLARLVARRGLGWTGLLAMGAGIAGLGASRSLAPALVAGVVVGVGYIISTMAFTTNIQADVPEALRGRVMALWTIAFLGPRPIAAVIGGALGDAIGPHIATALFAIPALGAAWFVRRTDPPAVEPVPPLAVDPV
jgi:MFS family permease